MNHAREDEIMKAKNRWILGTALFVTIAAAAYGCSNGTDTVTQVVVPADASAGCVANTKGCASPTLAQVCPADGSGWLALPCRTGEKCVDGACTADPAAKCVANSGSCLNAATALRCKADLAGYEQINCPTGTTCTGDGVCRGSCVVGSSTCSSTGVVSTCVDGKSFTPTACTNGELCVSTGTTPWATAACKPAACTPKTNGCDWACGNKNNAAADQTMFRSRCVESPSGYQWQAEGCLVPTTCNPSGASCSGGTQAACKSDCTPGQMRCSGDKLSTQTCGNDGKWGAVLQACNPTTGTGLQCMTKPGDSTKVVCGDPLCAGGASGTCDTGGVRLCGEDGRVAAAATACASGICVASGNPVGGLRPGACQTECLAGDERCVASGASNAFQTCANGRWSNVQTCPAAADGGAILCLGTTTTLGRPAKLCGGICAPGTGRCVAADGGTGSSSLQTCNASGQWDAPVQCAAGSCQSSGSVGARCVAECIPNALVCMGSAKAVAGTTSTGTDAFGTCTASGLLPASPTTCTGATVCRRNAAGHTLAAGGDACLECVGGSLTGGNESGLIDVRCANAGGDGGGTAATQQCSTGNVWAGGALSSCANLSCSNGTCR